MLCPKCKTGRAHRSHRQGLSEYGASLFGLYPYRCKPCEHRFLRRRESAAEPMPKSATAVEREVRATRKAIQWKRKRREFLLYGLGLLLFVAFLYFIVRDRGPSSDG